MTARISADLGPSRAARLLVAALLAILLAGGGSTAFAAIPGEGAWSWDGYGYVSIDGTTRIPGAYAKGIDVSGYNEWIDWEAVKASGIDFAMLRCGEVHRNYSTEESGVDSYFEYNRTECERLGIPYGIYYRSHATTLEEAKAETEHALQIIAGTNPTYPVYFDLEDADMGSVENAALLAQMHSVFCDAVAQAGFTPGVYASLYWFTTFYTDPVFDQWEKWVADWKEPTDDASENPLCRYADYYGVWQASSVAQVPGCSGHVDLDFLIDESQLDWDAVLAAGAEAQRIAEELAAAQAAAQGTLEFDDVPADSWFAGYVGYVAENGVMTGYRDGQGSPTGVFGSYDGISRAQIATILYRISNPGSAATTVASSYGADSGFSDVAGGQYYTEAIRWCKEQGIVTGYLDAAGNAVGFHPDALITREELATMIARYAAYRGWDVASTDISIVYSLPDGGSVSSYALTPMAWCMSHAIITGNAATNPPLIKPVDTATRAEAAKMIYVLLVEVLG